MSVIWYKVWFDLWHNKVRTLLAVLSIAAGVFAVGAIFGMNDQLLAGMDRAHAAVSPSHINMFLNTRIDRDTAISLKKIKGVEDVEPYNQVTVRYKIRPEEDWRQGVVDMRDDFEHQKYDVLQLQEGRWPGKDSIGIERLSSQYWNVDIGDRIIFKIGNTERALPITGKIRGPMVLPPLFGGQAQFIMDAEGLTRFDVPEGKFAALRVRVTPYSDAFAKEIASQIKERLAKQGVGVAATFMQDPNKHWGRPFIEGFNLVLQILAVVSLFASVVLVFNTLTAIITQQTDQIGIIKAIGGTTGTIVKVYLAGVLVYGVLALAISLPLGTFTAFSLTQTFLNLFNIDYNVFQVSNRAVVLQVLAAIAVPLLAALWPVLSGAAITVRQAIASYGLGGDFGSSWLDLAVEHIGQRILPSHYAIALSNMFRRKGRLILTQLVLVTAGSMFLMVMTLSSSIARTLDNDFARSAYDTRLQFYDNQRIDRTVAIALEVEGVEKAEVTFSQPATILRQGQKVKEAGLGAELTGIPRGSDMYRPLIVAGRWLKPGDGRAIVMSKETADKNNIQIGDTVTLDLGELGKDDWQLVGLYQLIFGGEFSVNTIYAPQDAIFEAAKKYNQGAILDVRTRVHTEAYAGAVTAQLKELYEGRNMKVYFSRTVYESRHASDNQFGLVMIMLLSVAVIVAVVGGVGLMGSLSISVVERTKEIGVMRAIGARSGTIMGMFVMEGVLQGLLSWAIALPLSFILSQPVARALGQVMFQANLDYQYNFGAATIWLVLIVVISALASILPARNATRISVRESLAYA
jgi:putative ABC transport system permease protein